MQQPLTHNPTLPHKNMCRLLHISEKSSTFVADYEALPLHTYPLPPAARGL